MERYNFVDLIRRHSVPFEVITYTEGGYDARGKYQQGTETISNHFGAILPMTDSKIYESGGTYTTKDRTLYMSTPLPQPMKNLKVRYDGMTYKVESTQDFSDYSHAYIYTLKWIEPVSGGGLNG